MKLHLIASIAAVCLAVSAVPAQSSPYPQANKYFQVRDRALVADSFTADEIQTQPDKYAGKLLEVRGGITAIAGSDTLTTVLIGGAGSTAATQFTLPPKKDMSQWPFLNVGANIRALCQVVTLEGSSTGSLELVTAVREHEALVVDQARDKAAQDKRLAAERQAAAQRRAKPQVQRMASRGVGSTTVRQGMPGQAVYTRAQILELYTSAVRHFNRRLTYDQAQRIATAIINNSETHGLDARLVMAVVAVESNFNQHAVSPVGAMGLGQLMPGTASDLGVGNAFDLQSNLEGSTRLLRNHIKNMSNGRPTDEAIKLALACYNAGAGAVRKYKGIPPYRETQNYVKKITRLYRQMCGYDS